MRLGLLFSWKLLLLLQVSWFMQNIVGNPVFSCNGRVARFVQHSHLAIIAQLLRRVDLHTV